ncbi:hypothetical protein PVAP13_5NG056808 [Panicum virgatum]|uniref:Uncharacterized protein n=1 Tax=Panicum virgatum TaxID=38727 RepID=A0A8T0RNI2_PANVG|nr:hypothetical protein PVAP13_5NG056808 [Panicum virgatum]
MLIYGDNSSVALFLTCLGTFKVGLLAASRGPLEPASPALHFVLAVALPRKLTSAGARSPRAAPAVATRSKAEQAESLDSCELKEGRSITEEVLWHYLSKYTLEMLCIKKIAL